MGSLALLGKGIFLFRKSSEGIGLTYRELAELSESAEHKPLPSLPAQASQILQDFGVGGLLLWPLLNLGRDFDHSWNHPPKGPVFLTGAVLFGLGWLVRRLTTLNCP